MLTLLGSLLGFFTSLAPNFLKLWQDTSDQRHELALFDRQLKLLKHQHAYKIDELREAQLTQEVQHLYQHAAPVGVKWVDALSGTVRPILTYGFFFLFCVIKYCQVVTILNISDTLSLSSALMRTWHEEDQALFAAVMSFWFGQRALRNKK